MALPTSEPALASGTTSYTSGQEPDILGPNPTHQQGNTSPKTTIALQLGMAGPSSHQQSEMTYQIIAPYLCDLGLC